MLKQMTTTKTIARTVLFAVVVQIALAGCASNYGPSLDRLPAQREWCRANGYEAGSPELKSCVLQLEGVASSSQGSTTSGLMSALLGAAGAILATIIAVR